MSERNFGIIISNQLLHCLEEGCRKGRTGVGHGCRVVENPIREKRGQRIIISFQTRLFLRTKRLSAMGDVRFESPKLQTFWHPECSTRSLFTHRLRRRRCCSFGLIPIMLYRVYSSVRRPMSTVSQGKKPSNKPHRHSLVNILRAAAAVRWRGWEEGVCISKL